MLTLIHAAFPASNIALPSVMLDVERHTLVKRLWRGTAGDGMEFGFELEVPLQDGDSFWETSASRYLIRQLPEPVLEVSLAIAGSAAAGIGWAVGNLHLELAAEPTRLLGPDEPALRALLERLRVPYTSSTAVFRPGRFARGGQSLHELGPSHRH